MVAISQSAEATGHATSGGSQTPSKCPGAEPEFSYESFYREHFGRLVARITRLIGCRETAEDVAQETLIRIWEKPHLLDPERPAWPFIQKVGMNLAYDHVRARARHQRITQERIEGKWHASATDELGRIDDRLDLAQLLCSLSARHRTAIGLRHVLDLEVAEVAARMDVGMDAAYALIHRAKRALQSAYESAAAILWPGFLLGSWGARTESRTRLALAGASHLAVGVALGSAVLGIAITVAPIERARADVAPPIASTAAIASQPRSWEFDATHRRAAVQREASRVRLDRKTVQDPPAKPSGVIEQRRSPWIDTAQQDVPLTGHRLHTELYDEPDYDYGVALTSPDGQELRTGTQSDSEAETEPVDELACEVASSTPMTYCERSPGKS